MSELNGSAQLLHTNVFTNGVLLATILPVSSAYPNGDTQFALHDWLGTKRVTLGASGCAQTWVQYQYGDGLVSNGTLMAGQQLPTCPTDSTEHHFTGKERDSEPGLDYFGARYYQSTMGRWMSPDWSANATPIPNVELLDPQNLNLYLYEGDAPLNGIDHNGHDCELCQRLSAAIRHIVSVKTSVTSGTHWGGSVAGLKVSGDSGASLNTIYHPFDKTGTTQEAENKSTVEVKAGPYKLEGSLPMKTPGADGKPAASAGASGVKVDSDGQISVASVKGTLTGAAGPGGGVEVNLDVPSIKEAAENCGPALRGGAEELLQYLQINLHPGPNSSSQINVDPQVKKEQGAVAGTN